MDMNEIKRKIKEAIKAGNDERAEDLLYQLLKIHDCMSERDSFGLQGKALIKELVPGTNRAKSMEVVSNVVVADRGLEWIADLMAGEEPAESWNYLAVGSDGMDESFEDDSLGDREAALECDIAVETGSEGYETLVKFGPVKFEVGTAGDSVVEAALSAGAESGSKIFNRLTFAPKDNERNDLELTLYVDVGDLGLEI